MCIRSRLRTEVRSEPEATTPKVIHDLSHQVPTEGISKMNLTRFPSWALILLGVIAVVAGVLGVIHAPLAIGKVGWAVVAGVGIASIIWAVWRMKAATSSKR